ncbi:MAG: Tetratricopeptide repeat protein [Acidobacteriaceae bacterium]|nr:Tetratricopeptide repeat protein [Acidobacteriaceae bacterium]
MGLGLRGFVLAAVGACFWIAGCSSTYSYQTELLRAEQLTREGKPFDALAIYERTLPRIPEDNRRERAVVLISAGNCLAEFGRLNEAFADFQKATEIDPENLESRLHLAEFFVAAGVPNHAVEHLNFVLSRNPEDAEALGLLGTVEAAAQHFHRARELLEHSFANDPQRPNVAVALAEIYNREDKVAKARSLLVKAASAAADIKRSAIAWLALGRLEEQEGIAAAAEQAYRSAVTADNSVLTNFRLAQFLERSARMEEAEKVLTKVDSLRPSEPSALADFQLNRGLAAEALITYASPRALKSSTGQDSPSLFAGKMSNGPSIASRMIEAQLLLDSKSKSQIQIDDALSARSLLARNHRVLDGTAAAVLQAEAALAQGNLAEAESKAKLAVARGPESPAAHYVRGVVFKRQNKIAEAKEEWNSALEADSEYVPAQLALAGQNLDERDLLTAEEHVSSVVRDEPANLDALCLYARVLLAQARLASARGIAKRALALDGKSTEPHLVLGQIEMAAKHYGASFIEYQKALLLDSESAEAMDGLMNVYRRGRLTRAVLQKMERVAAAPPSSAALMELAGRLYAQKGFQKDAARVLTRVLEIEPQRQSARVALAESHYANGDANAAAELIANTFPEKTSSAALQLRAAQAQQHGDLDQAIASYESAMRSGDSSGLVANNLAWAYAQRGSNLDRALELARIAVERDPKNVAALDTLGFVELRRRNFSEAAGALSKAVSLMEGKEWSAQKPEVYRRLADAYLGAGLPAKSADARAKAERLSAR